MNKLVTIHILLDADYIDGAEISIEEALENNFCYNDFIADWIVAEKGEKFFNFDDYVWYEINEEDLTTPPNAGTITLSEVLKKLSEPRLYMTCLKIHDDGSGRITARTPDNGFKEYLVFKFKNLEDLMGKLNE